MKRGAAIEFPVVCDRDLKFAGWSVRHVQGIWRGRYWRVTGRVQIALFFYARRLLLDGIECFI